MMAVWAASSDVCPYTSPVIATEECPSSSTTAFDVYARFEPRHGRRVAQRMHADVGDADRFRGDSSRTAGRCVC